MSQTGKALKLDDVCYSAVAAAATYTNYTLECDVGIGSTTAALNVTQDTSGCESASDKAKANATPCDDEQPIVRVLIFSA